ncbi:hypothetical protein E4U31_007813 [Claviceps sp. LM219 group G6]|nr:hypothetical protein E4U31_007813 [Claviceps sp. LM219 group G6]
MPAPAESQPATLRKFVDAWKKWDADEFIVRWEADEATGQGCGVAPLYKNLIETLTDYKNAQYLWMKADGAWHTSKDETT